MRTQVNRAFGGLLAAALFCACLCGVGAVCAESGKVEYELAFEDRFDSGEIKEEWTGVVGSKASGDAEFGYAWDFGADKAIVFNGDLTGDQGKMFMGDDGWRNYVVEVKIRGAMMNAGIGVRATETNTFDCEYRGLLVCFDTGGEVGNYVRLGALSNPGWNDLFSAKLPGSFDADEFHDVRIYAVEDNIRVFVDGVKYIDRIVPQFPTGKVGFRAYAFDAWIGEDVTFDDFKVYRPKTDGALPDFRLEEAFSDTFSETAFNSDNRYRILDDAAAEIVDENGNKALRYSGDNQGGFLYDTGDLKNYAVSMKIKSVNSNAGILMRAQGGSTAESIGGINSFAVIFDAASKCWRPAECTEPWPNPIQLNIGQRGYLGADYVEVKVVLVENYVQIFLDGDSVPLVSGRTNTFASGGVGFRYVPWEGGDVLIDDFKVYEVKNSDAVALPDEGKTYAEAIAVSDFMNQSDRTTSGDDVWTADGDTISLAKDCNSSTVYSKKKWTDVNVTASFKAVGGGLNAGILFRATLNAETADPAGAYFATYDGQTGTLSLGKFESGIYQSLAYAKLFLQSDEYRMTVKTDNACILVYVNDELILRANDESFQEGYVGVKGYTKEDFGAASVKMVLLKGSIAPLPRDEIELVAAGNGEQPTDGNLGGGQNGGGMGALALTLIIAGSVLAAAGIAVLLWFIVRKRKK